MSETKQCFCARSDGDCSKCGVTSLTGETGKRWDFGKCEPETTRPQDSSGSAEFNCSVTNLAGLTKDENMELTLLKNMTIKRAGVRGMQRFNELCNKVIAAIIIEHDK